MRLKRFEVECGFALPISVFAKDEEHAKGVAIKKIIDMGLDLNTKPMLVKPCPFGLTRENIDE